MIKFTVSKLPSGSAYWVVFFKVNSTDNRWWNSWCDLRPEGVPWEVPMDVYTDTLAVIAVELYDANRQILPASWAKNYQYNVPIRQDGDYRLDYAGNTIEAIGPKDIQHLIINTDDTTPKQDGSFYVTYSFDYKGGYSNKVLAKLALGVIFPFTGGFDTKVPPWFTAVILPDAIDYKSVSGQFAITLPTVGIGKYAASIVIGPSPWPVIQIPPGLPFSNVYGETRVDAFITVISGTGGNFSNLTVEIEKSAGK